MFFLLCLGPGSIAELMIRLFSTYEKIHTRWFDWFVTFWFPIWRSPTTMQVNKSSLNHPKKGCKELPGTGIIEGKIFSPPFLYQKRSNMVITWQHRCFFKGQTGHCDWSQTARGGKTRLGGGKERKVSYRDPGSPKLRMGAWKLNTLHFGGDCIPLHHPLTGWDKIPRVGWNKWIWDASNICYYK